MSVAVSAFAQGLFVRHALSRGDPTLHSEAADIVFGETPGSYMAAGSPHLWTAQGSWNTEDRYNFIKMTDFCAVRLLLVPSLERYLEDLTMTKGWYTRTMPRWW